MGGLATPTTFVEEWSSSAYIRLDVNLIEKCIEVFFYHLNAQYRLRVRYGSTLKNTILQRSDKISTLIVAAKYPAYFWRKSSAQEPRETYDFSCWERVTEIPMNNNTTLRLENWSVYKVELEIDNQTHEMLARRIEEATQSVLQVQAIRTDREYKPKVEQSLAQFPFEVQYMLQHTFNLKILREYNVEGDFYHAISTLEPHIACRLLSLISAGQHRLYDPNTAINNIFKHNSNLTDPAETIPEDYTYLRKVIITPTSIYPLHPVVQKMNHLQYQHKKYADRFLLVEFTDEELTPIIPTPHPNQNDKLYSRIFKILKKGLVVAGRNYEFLCASTENLRAHSCWFFAPVEGFDRKDIVYWMGDFEEIKSIPKYISSVGQVTAPRLTDLQIQASEVEEIADYEHNNIVFSRDCGKMSPHVAREIASLLQLNYTPNVIRFNLAGAQGILMLSNYLQKRKIQLRTGQIHFNTNRLTLEVIKVSKKKRAYLNFHSISLLTGLGVRPTVFQQISESLLQDYFMASPQKHSFLNTLMDEYYSEHFTPCFQHVLFSGFLERGDPLITNLVLAFQNKVLHELKQEAKMYVEGARAFAIMDETGSLEQDEVFFQTFTPRGMESEMHVIQGYVLIYRDSSYSPKDVIIAKAVDCPKLKSYTNVLVYPAIGLKDLPNCCSNEGTEKDDFTIIWDQRLVPYTSNRAPCVLTEIESPKLDREITFKDMAKFFVNYISSDLTSLAQDAWMAAADRHESSIYHGNAAYLAAKLSTAIGFAKTGISDSLATDPTLTELYEYPIPDFMSQDRTRSYLSKKPLGYMHRTSQSIDKRPYVSNKCEYDPRMYVDGMHRYILEARRTRDKYDNGLRLLMGEYGVRSEIEFISGLIVNWSKYISKNSKREVSKNIREAYRQFKLKWRRLFEAEFYEEELQHLSEEELNERVEAKAAAWYYVTYHPNESRSSNKTIEMYSRYISFPWIVDDYVVHIAKKNSDRPPLAIYRQPLPESLIDSQAHNIATYIVEESDSEEENDSEDESNL
ncbi:unnamed protein product [Rhizopus stolonifer]